MRRPVSLATARSRWPLALLLASLAVTGFAAFDAHRTSRSDSGVARRTLQGYGAFAAWAYSHHLQEALHTMARDVIGPVNHGGMLHDSRDVPKAEHLAHMLPFHEDCYCHRPRSGPVPEAFFAFDISSDKLDVAINTHPTPMEGWEIDRPLPTPAPANAFLGYTAQDAKTILSKIKQNARGVPDPDHGFTYLVTDLGVGPRLVTYTLMPTVWGDTMVYGAQYSPQAVRGLLKEIYADAELLPDTIIAGRKNRDLVDVEVVDSAGQKMFASERPLARELDSREGLPIRYASLGVRAAIKPDLAGTLIVGGLPRSRLPILFGLLAISLALSLVAVAQLRRESELAAVRADWISSVSHELRTPLAQIRLYVDTVRLGRAAGPEQRDWALAHVDRETTRLSHLIENVLSFSRLSRGVDVPAKQTDIGAETHAIVNEFRPLAAARRATIDAAIDHVAPIDLRPDTLRHILLNLLDNAVKYGPEGQTVRVSVRAVAGEIQIAVADQGPGVPRAEHAAIWRPFTRGATSLAAGGSGIGLTIVRDLAAQHGGRAWVESASPTGPGARFVVALPSRAST